MGNKKGIIIVITLILLVGTGSFVFANEENSSRSNQGESKGTIYPSNTPSGDSNSNINNSSVIESGDNTENLETSDDELDHSKDDGINNKIPQGTTGSNNRVSNQNQATSNNGTNTPNHSNSSTTGTNVGNVADNNGINSDNNQNPTPTESPRPTEEPGPAVTPTPIPTQGPIPTEGPKPTEEPGPVVTPTPNPTQEPTPTESPKPTEEPGPVVTPTPNPTQGPIPTENPTPDPDEDQDKTYELALEAVKKAQNSQLQDDIEEAWKLVNNVTDSTKKKELQEELKILQRVLDSIALVNKLAELVESATDKADIEKARQFRTNEQLVVQVISLPDSEVKTNLLNQLQQLAKILDDKTVPEVIVTGINNNGFTNENVSITIKDATDVKVYLNHELITNSKDLLNVTEEGTYELVVIDQAFNETTKSFTIDKTSPIILGITQNSYKVGEIVNIAVNEPGAVLILYKDGVPVTNYQQGTNIAEDGTYSVYAEDKAGNLSETYTFIVDRTLPTATIEYNITTPTQENVVATLTNESEEIVVVNNNHQLQYTFTSNNEFTFIIRDKVGNEAEVKAIVNNIDREAPTYKDLGMINISNMNTEESISIAKPGDEILAFVTFDEKLAVEPIFTIDEQEIQSRFDEENSKEGKFIYTIKYIIPDTEEDKMLPIKVSGYADEAGNVGTTLTEKDINNKSYPQISVIVNTGFEFINGKTFSTDTIIIKEPNYGYMLVYNWATKEEKKVVETTYKLPTNTRYTFTLFDKDGIQMKEVTMTFDNLNPDITATGLLGNKTEIVKENTLYDSVTLTMIDNEMKYIKRIYEDGTEEIIREFQKQDSDKQEYTRTFTQGGNYQIEVIDKAGNKSSVCFSIKEKSIDTPTIVSAFGTLE